MKLEELIPSLELCKKIPTGEFADSAFYWFEELQKMNEKPPHDYRYFVNFADFHGYGWGGGRCCPAPTVQEIFTRLPNMYALNGDFLNPRMFITLRNKEIKKHGLIIPDVALKIWFQVKGIKCDEYDL